LFFPSNTHNRLVNLLKTFIQSAILWTVFLYLVPTFLVKQDIWTFRPYILLGWLLFFIFSALGLYSGFVMSYHGDGTPLPLDCTNKLVIRGPYKYIRNPMAVAGIGQGISVGIIMGSPLVIIYALLGAFLWNFLVRPIEERDLENRFGKQFVHYKNDIHCWIPKF